MSKPDQYINQSLADGLAVLKKFMADLSPFTWYTVNEIGETMDFDYAKTFRIIKTLQVAGFVDTDDSGKRYQLSRNIISLSYQFLKSIEREHLRLKQRLEEFNISPELHHAQQQ